ncbi:MAG: hypothetical protein ACOY0T_17610 [Myxococcota bacterium]
MKPQSLERLVLVAGCVAVFIFSPFVAYAFLSRAVYRTTALVRVKPAADAKIQLPPPLEAARRLRDAVLDGELIERLARDKSSASVAEARDLRVDFELDTIDSQSFSVSFRATDPVRARDMCNRLARRTVQSAPQALTTSVDEETERSQRVDELVAFLASHADAAAPAGSALAVNSAQAREQAREELARATLRSERARLAQKLEAAAALPGSDNPYADQEQSPELMKRRIAEIDRLLATRPKVEAAPLGSATPEVEAQWRKLVQAVSASERPANPNVTALTAALVTEAPLPTSPIEPNRKLILLIGFLTSLAAAGLVVIAQSAASSSSSRRSRRRSSSTVRVSERGWKTPTGSIAPDGRGATQPNYGSVAPPNYGSAPPPNHGSVAPPNYGSAPPGAGTMPLDMTMPIAPKIVPVGVIEVKGTSVPAPPGEVSETVVAEARAVEAQPNEGRAVEARPNEERVAEARPADARADTMLGETQAIPGQAIPGRPMRARGRVTQVLGSPVIAEAVAAAGSAATSSYPPPGEPPPPPAENGSAPPPGNDPGVGARNTSSGPPRPKARVSPLDVSRSFRPDPSLVPAARRTLRDALLPYTRQPGFVVAVLGSDDCAEWKSRVAAELALALAVPDQCRLLMVECDFASPHVQRWMRVEVPIAAGFSLQLQTRGREVGEEGWTVLHCSRSLDLLAEGAIRAPDALFASEFYGCLTSIRYHYDVVILDGPLLSQRAACRALDDVCDAVIAVSRNDEASLLREVAALMSPKPVWRVEAG